MTAVTSRRRSKPPLLDGQGHCIHYWRLEEPNGPVSWGECLRRGCKERRGFPNYLEEIPEMQPNGAGKMKQMRIGRVRV